MLTPFALNMEVGDASFLLGYKPDRSPSSIITIIRVFWSSPDSFDVYYQGILLRYCIINYSTYAREDGSGKQMIYLDKSMIGKTLTIIGCLDTDYCIESHFDVK